MKQKKKTNKKKTNIKSQNGTRTQWHPAFYAAARLELRENKDDLQFFSEYDINTKPITIDVLIIRKNPGAVIHNEIGSFFKGYNIIEYKSPRDALNIDTLHKGIGYASLYKSRGSHVNEIRADDITLTFIRHGRPRELFRTLDREGGVLEPESPGIYLIKGLSTFETRIIVTSELDSAQHVWLNVLRDNLPETDAERFIMSSHELSAKDEIEFGNSVFTVAMTRNINIFNQVEEGNNDMSKTYQEFIQPLKDRLRAEVREEMIEEVRAEMIQEVRAENEAALQEKDALIEQMDTALGQMNVALEQQKAEIIELKRLLAESATVQSVAAE